MARRSIRRSVRAIKIKNIKIILPTFILSLSLFGCASQAASNETEKNLVVYFSQTGTTEKVANQIAEYTSTTIYEIVPAQEYTEEDLDWNDSSSRATQEQNDDSIRPEIGSEKISIEEYTTIYIGYPIWWGQEPRIIDSFIESMNFEGKTVIPFCTSGSSGIEESAKRLEKRAKNGYWQEGKRFGPDSTEKDIQNWIDSLDN